MTAQFGKFNPTQQNKGFSKYKTFYLQDGDNIYRVLPPVHSLADKNKIAQYYSVIWLMSPSGRKYAVNSILVKNKDGRVIQPDPLLEKIEQINLSLKQAILTGDQDQVQNLKDMQKKIFNKKVYALNAMSVNGEIGVLYLTYTAYQNLQAKLKELYLNGIDAISVGAQNGLFFNFKKLRDERGRVTYPVDVAMKTQKSPTGEIVATYHRAPITEEDAASIAERSQDLTTLFRTLSYNEMMLLSSLTQEAFDAVFSNPQNASDEVSGDDDLSEEESTSGLGDSLLSATQHNVSKLNTADKTSHTSTASLTGTNRKVLADKIFGSN